MAFIVINVVKATKEELPGILMNVQRLGLDALRAQPGFNFARLLVSEDQTEAKLIIEWENREAFVAYRQSDTGRKMVDGAVDLHPQIEFYEVIAAYD
jgi:heme-degrading monooxygenase HmoA